MPTTRTFIVLAALVSGILAGTNIDRALVAMPAWQQLGAPTWAAFTRYASLGNGLFIYPVEAIAAVLLTLSAAIGSHYDRGCSRVVRSLLDGAAALTIGGLALTVVTTPAVLSVRNQNDPAVLQRAMEAYWFWGNLRGAAHVLAFIAELAALDVLLHPRNSAD